MFPDRSASKRRRQEMELIATATFTNMAKRLLVLLVLAAMLAATAPAFA
jgi:hypothetical protein